VQFKLKHKHHSPGQLGDAGRVKHLDRKHGR
jgi:hypothetical protein